MAHMTQLRAAWHSVKRWLEFSLWYYRDPPWDTGISPPELLAFMQQHPAGNALDLGCGTGTNAIMLARNGWQVTGVDFAMPAIQRARRKACAAGVQVDFRADDVTRLSGITGPFDLILDIGCFHSLTNSARSTYRDNARRLLRTGGSLLLYVHLSDADTDHHGLLESDLDLFAPHFMLAQREDGVDGSRRSAWLTYIAVREMHRAQDVPNISL
jgi:SAM-dependent methyltransferase